jgi:diguanylate cyclase (GGDEF)-like protein/PAS domain S-box-containing protein
VLLLGSDPELAASIREMFNQRSAKTLHLFHVSSLEDAGKHLAAHKVDVVLLDFSFTHSAGVDAIGQTHPAAPRVPIVLLCTEEEKQIAIETYQDDDAREILVKGQFEVNQLLRTIRNACARKSLQRSQFADMDRARLTLNSIGDGVISTDRKGNISYLNPVAEAMTGWPLEDVSGRPLAYAFRIIDASTGLAAANPMKIAFGDKLPAKMPANCILVRRDGRQIHIEDSVAPIRDSNGLAAGFVLVFRDVTEAHTLTAQLAHLAEHDALTGLPNRLLLSDRLNQAVARAARDKGLVAVLFLDLDRFKHINDSLGHQTGDELLKVVSNSLLESVRCADTVSRLGGDEFIVLLAEVRQLDYCAIAARRILNAVGKSHLVAGNDLRITASIGISVFPDDGLDAETLIRNADRAMYHAKESGKQTFKFFTNEMNVVAVRRQGIEEDLRKAMDRSQLALHYQPKVDLKSGGITGVEALLRWTHPARGSVPPLDFIPIAEASGLMPRLGAWALRQACKQAKAWADADLPRITMAVNVSLLQFRDDYFLQELGSILDETGLDPQLLEIEVTESVLMQRPELTVRMFHILRDQGVRIAIDDFGTGYSSLSYLAKLPLDALKVDRSFIRHISTSPEHKAIVRAIISMARSLGLRVVAEGVETTEELDFLREQECDEAQGYLFSKALPANRLMSLFEEETARFSKQSADLSSSAVAGVAWNPAEF